ncbi:MAG: SpoIID/LytB domain-containing protein [Candidatus Brocadiae bacterium]|nr:SpoIID/LytB domain-containing protein [Candidatus Brocadiia bacterium]
MSKPAVGFLKATFQLACLGALGLSLYSCTTRPPERGRATIQGIQGPPVVRVALGKYFPAAGNTAPVAVEGEYRVVSARSGAQLHHGTALAAGAVAADRAGGIAVGVHRFPERDLRIVPVFDGTLKVGDRFYRGTLRAVVSDEGRLLLVNEVPLESYIAGVLGAEMPLDYPRAALEAQAVAARTYALFEMRRADQDGRSELWHVLDDTRSQVYSGTLRETEKARTVVQATRGVALLSGGRLFCAYFHSTCGGHTEAADLFFDVPRMSPLAGRPCEYCGKGKWSNWEVEIPKKDIAAKLGVKDVSGLRISQKTEGIHALKVEAGGQSWNGLAFRLAVGPDRLPSTAFDVEDRGANFAFRGRGYGHGVGMCQVGTKGMAELGYDSTEILRFYYPSAELLRLY